MKRYHILNLLIENYNLTSYLEIGVQDVRQCFNKINALKKVGVDPAVVHPLVYQRSSDEYFSMFKQKFDLIFIDGLHTHEQVKKDFINALEVLNENGFIMLHDTLPMQEETTLVPRVTKAWHGDVYKFVLEMNKLVPFITINTDEGCTIAWKGPIRKRQDIELSWESYLKNQEYLNIVQPNAVDFRHIRK
jgi:hypothetical protein